MWYAGSMVEYMPQFQHPEGGIMVDLPFCDFPGIWVHWAHTDTMFMYFIIILWPRADSQGFK